MRHISWLIILYTFIHSFTNDSFYSKHYLQSKHFNDKSNHIEAYSTLLPLLAYFSNNSMPLNNNRHFNQSKIDTCILSGLNFKIIEHRSIKSLHATIKNNNIEIVNNGVQYFEYHIVHYVFSSIDNGQIPTIRIFNGRVNYRILDILKYAKKGEKYNFEDIIVVDKSGKRLENEVRSIIIERI